VTTGPLTTLTRRAVLAGLAATASLSLTSAKAQSQIDKNKLYTQLRGNLDGSDGLWSYSGAYWGKPQGETARQLFRVDGLSYNTVTLREDGGVDQKMVECGFWQHPGTSELADAWTNPMNGLECEPKHFKSYQTLSFDKHGNYELPEDRSAVMRYVEGSRIVAPITNGPVIWSQERLFAKITRPEPAAGSDPLAYGGPLGTVASLVTYEANISDLDKAFVPTTMHYQSMGGWYSWMRMGQRAGGCSFELAGRKLPSTNEVPERVLAFLNDRRPGFVNDPWA
jgi:hypothetical protein